MKRSLKALLLAGVVTGALVGPAATAHAATCTGFMYDNGVFTEFGSWQCDPCPNALRLGDGRFHVVLCVDDSI